MKRFYMALIAVVVLAALTTAGSLALFTATTTNTGNTFTSGTVTLETTANTLVNVTNIAPGDNGAFNYEVTYTGSLQAWLGVDVTKGGDLFTCDGANSLQATLNGNPLNAGTNQLLGTAPVSAGTAVDIDIAWNLPIGADNDCQAKSASIGLLVHAVQAKNNTQPAPGVGPVSWGP